MYRKIWIPLTLLFIFGLQVPLALMGKKKLDAPFNLDTLITGEFGMKLEEFLSSEVPFFRISGKTYRELLFKYLNKYSDNVRVKEKGYIFLPGRTFEMKKKKFTSIGNAVNKIVMAKKLLKNMVEVSTLLLFLIALMFIERLHTEMEKYLL